MKRLLPIFGLLCMIALFALSDAAAQKTQIPERETSAKLSVTEIDSMLRKEWHKNKIVPAPPVDDAGYLRRIYLDITGTIPPAETVKAFLADRSADKRAKAVETLLNSPGYVNHWTNYWDNVLMGKQTRSPLVDRVAFRQWLGQQFTDNARWNRMVHNLLTASGQNSPGGNYGRALGMAMSDRRPGAMEMTEETGSGTGSQKINGAVNWTLKYMQTPADLTGAASRIFLGVQIQCAQCHDHKTEKWKQEDFRRLAACFSQARPVPIDTGQVQGIRRVELRDMPGFGRGGRRPLRGNNEYVGSTPAALDGTDFSSSLNRRQALADWMTAPENPWFAEAIVNRMWGHFLGRGFVDPVDDFRESNPPVMPELMKRLADDFVARDYDLKHLIRTICATRAYQLSSAPLKKGEKDNLYWARYRLKPMQPEALLDSLITATNLQPIIERVGGGRVEQVKFTIQRQFSFLFDVDEEFEQKEFEGTIPQAFLFLNSNLVNSGSSAIPGTALAEVMAMEGDDAKKVESLYLRALSRKPTPAELKRWVAFVNAPRDVAVNETTPPPAGRERIRRVPNPGRRDGGFDPLAGAGRFGIENQNPKQQAFEDLFWALLNSSEFHFNH
jgi:hypothetical protein